MFRFISPLKIPLFNDQKGGLGPPFWIIPPGWVEHSKIFLLFGTERSRFFTLDSLSSFDSVSVTLCLGKRFSRLLRRVRLGVNCFLRRCRWCWGAAWSVALHRCAPVRCRRGGRRRTQRLPKAPMKVSLRKKPQVGPLETKPGASWETGFQAAFAKKHPLWRVETLPARFSHPGRPISFHPGPSTDPLREGHSLWGPRFKLSCVSSSLPHPAGARARRVYKEVGQRPQFAKKALLQGVPTPEGGGIN